MTAVTWFDSSDSAVWNMASDKTLLKVFGLSATSILRLYCWIKPAVTCGKSQPLPTLKAVRRPIVGGIVQQGQDTAYAVILPVEHPWNKIRRDEYYREIHSIIAGALTEVGVKHIHLQPEMILSFSLWIHKSIPLLPINWNKAILPPFLYVFLCIFMILVFIIYKFAQIEMESEYAG